jgi:hypothetical protein
MARKKRPEPRTTEERAAEHRRQVNMQIWLPLIGGLIVALGLAALAILGTIRGSSEVNRWGNISAVYLIIPTLFTSLITLAILVLCIVGVSKLAGKMPGWLARAQGLFAYAAGRIRQAADRLVEPIVSINSTANGYSRGLNRLFKRERH